MDFEIETENDLSENIELEERTSSFKAEICTDIIQTISHVVLARMIADFTLKLAMHDTTPDRIAGVQMAAKEYDKAVSNAKKAIMANLSCFTADETEELLRSDTGYYTIIEKLSEFVEELC